MKMWSTGGGNVLKTTVNFSSDIFFWNAALE